nr:DNA-directed DNA polymerase [Tanacetum cinerariifolium]
MRTRSQSYNNFPQQEASPAIVEPLRIELPFLEDQFQEDPPVDPPEVLMADNQTMAELLQAPTEGYEDAIVIPKIAVNNFELKHGLINLVQNKQFFKHDKEDPHAHIRYFNKITSTMRVPNGMSTSWIFELHQLDTFYNALNVNDQDSLNSAAGGNFLDKMPQECLKIIKRKSKVRQSRAKAVVAKVSTSSSTPAISSEVSELKDMLSRIVLLAVALTHTKIVSLQAETFIETTSKSQLHRPHVNQPPAYQAPAYQAPIPQTQSVTQTDFESYIKANDALLRNMQSQGQGPPIPTLSKVVKQGTEVTKDQVQTPSSQSSAPVQPPVIRSETQTPVSEPVVAPLSVSMPNLKPSIPYPSRRDNERRRDQANEQIGKFYEIFKEMSFEISFTDALIPMPKFTSTLKVLFGNKEKLSEMARTPMNEHCLTVILNKLPRKLGDPEKFLIPCEFPGMDECLALADLGTSINLMPLSVWEGLLLLELTSTCMTLELADHSVSKPIGIAKDVSVKTGQALIDVHKGELTLRIENEAITYNLDQTVRYLANYNQMTANKIDVICEMYSQEVLGFSNVTASGNPTPYDDPIVSITSPTLTPFGDSDFLLFKEADAFLGLEDDPNLLEFNPFYYDPDGGILLLEAILNTKTVKSSVDEPPKVKLKDLPPHLEYAFLEGDNKFPVIISKELGDEEKSALIKVLKSHKRAIAWKLSDIQEVEKLLDAGLIYPISDSPWVSPVHCVPKKGGFIVVENEENELIPTRLVTGWREKTTFTCPYGTFAYRCMPFGLCNAPGTFQRCMLAIFHDMVEKTMEVFMDDFSVFGNSFENCLSRLDKMLQRCEDTNLSLNWEKSHFMVKEGIVLDHKISKNGIEVDRAKVDVIAKLPHPTTVKGIRSFLGHADFYRRFIQDFSKISRPMTHLLEKNTPFIFFEDYIKAFQTLKKRLTEAPILIALNWDLTFELMCDATDFAIGAVLGQRHEKHFKPIHYASKTMNDAESNYTTTEKEMLAVVYAFEKF